MLMNVPVPRESWHCVLSLLPYRRPQGLNQKKPLNTCLLTVLMEEEFPRGSLEKPCTYLLFLNDPTLKQEV